MFYKKAHRVALSAGILLILSLVVFGSMIAVAWMSLDNTTPVTSDNQFTEKSIAKEYAVCILSPKYVAQRFARDMVSSLGPKSEVQRFAGNMASSLSPENEVQRFTRDMASYIGPKHVAQRIGPKHVAQRIDILDAVCVSNFGYVAYRCSYSMVQ